MPRKKQFQQQHRPIIEEYPDPADLNSDFQEEQDPVPEPEPQPTRQSRKKNRNAVTRPTYLDESSPEPPIDEPVAPLPDPEEGSHSLPNHVNLPIHAKSRPVNIREDRASIEKVSDQYTPPSDAGLPDHLYGKSPDSTAISSAANTPPVEPGFSRSPYKFRSPPISPPQRNVRPVSTGGVPQHHYPPTTYGSPPAPHLPQPHFYRAQDVDLGIPKPVSKSNDKSPNFTKFVRLPANAGSTAHGFITAQAGRISLFSYDGATAEAVGALGNLPGTPVDADILQWSTAPDPFAALRPLVVITTLHFDDNTSGLQQYWLTVSVHSLLRQQHLFDLLHTPPQPIQHDVPLQFRSDVMPADSLRLETSSNYLIVTTAQSGEVFVFSPVIGEAGPTFECIKKLWTSIQPQAQPRGSSHNRHGNADAFRATSRNTKPDVSVPLLSVSGRWLAVCPPVNPSLQTAGIVLGDTILSSKQAGLEATSAGAKPVLNCGVDSPDADTLFGKVARGVAKEMMKAGKWLGEQGMSAWQSYWKKEDASPAGQLSPAYANQTYPSHGIYGHFPPTHAEAQQVGQDPELVSVYDLKAMQDPSARKSAATGPFATFQPPNGCSFLSFAPNGLVLLTASRKGDYQYIWDLLEVRHNRTLSVEPSEHAAKSGPRVRQLARFDRLSGSVVVDVVWELPTLSRLSILTQNKTIHLFDLPQSAFRWPPPRRAKKGRPISAPPNALPVAEHGEAPVGGFFASAMNFAGKTQPMIANLRGRTPSTSGGLAGIGQAGFGFATATGARGSKAVATGLSKSLGAATGTVTRIQHAGETRLHLKSDRDVAAGRIIWLRRASKAGLSVLNEAGLKHYQVSKSRSQDTRHRNATVFDARKAVGIKLPVGDRGDAPGFWSPQAEQQSNTDTMHPLSFAEIDTNAPFQPFHSDRRVTVSIFNTEKDEGKPSKKSKKSKSTEPILWVFGDDIPTLTLNLHQQEAQAYEETGSIIYRETTLSKGNTEGGEQIVSTTRRKKPKRGTSVHGESMLQADDELQEGFFEDDCDVLDFADNRV